MTTAKISIISYEGPVEGLASVLQSFGGVFSALLPRGELIAGELLSTKSTAEPAAEETPSDEAAREAPAKPRAKRKAPGVSRKDLSEGAEEAPRAKGQQAGSMSHKIRSAFRLNNNYPLTTLAKDCYGDSSGESMRKLKGLITQLVGSGDLKRVGASAYGVVTAMTGEPTETE